MLCASGFMDDVVFAHKPRLLDVAAQLKRSAHAALGLTIKSRVGILVTGKGRTGLLLAVGLGGSSGGVLDYEIFALEETSR